MGISAFVVRDTVELDGELVEDTYDWFAQDDEGNVWYLGEDVKDYENGVRRQHRRLVGGGRRWRATRNRHASPASTRRRLPPGVLRR